MSTIFDNGVRESLLQRIAKLNKSCEAEWGKMTVDQMILHCLLWDEMAQLQRKYTQTFIGRIFGKLVLKSFLKEGELLKRNVESFPEIIVSERGDTENDKLKWQDSINKYSNLPDKHEFIHPFFGKVNREQTGRLAFKHTDHHLRQFGL